jgi:hypothetical protein
MRAARRALKIQIFLSQVQAGLFAVAGLVRLNNVYGLIHPAPPSRLTSGVSGIEVFNDAIDELLGFRERSPIVRRSGSSRSEASPDGFGQFLGEAKR